MRTNPHIQVMNDVKIKQNTADLEFNGELDLHHFASEDTEFLVKALLDESAEKGITRVRIAHGKGRSAKKRRIRAVLADDPRVISFTDDGTNWGATIAYLKND